MSGDLRFVTAKDYLSFGGPEPHRFAFSQLGNIDKRLFQLHLLRRVGNTVFAHGSINEEWAERGVRSTNRDTTRELPHYTAEKNSSKRLHGWSMFNTMMSLRGIVTM